MIIKGKYKIKHKMLTFIRSESVRAEFLFVLRKHLTMIFHHCTKYPKNIKKGG